VGRVPDVEGAANAGLDLLEHRVGVDLHPESVEVPVEHRRFEQFVTTPPLKGLGANMRLIEKLIDSIEELPDRREAQDLLDRALQRPSHLHAELDQDGVDNIHVRPSGTSKEAGLRRLRKDRPDLHTEVLAGRLSTHAAMVKAGFRQRKISIPVTSAEDAAKALRRNLDPDQVRELVKLLADD